MKNFLNELVKPFADTADSESLQKIKQFFKEWVVPVLIALVIVLFLNKFVFILVTVPTASLKNNIITVERLCVNELIDVEIGRAHV